MFNEYDYAQSLKLSSNKYVALLSPRGKESYNNGEEIEIKWAFLNLDKIKIEIFDSVDSWQTIANEIDASIMSFKFKLNRNHNKFKLRLSDISDSTIYDISPYFLDVISHKPQEPKINFNRLLKSSSANVLKIMPLGNSITEGRLSPKVPPYNGYRKKLSEILSNKGLNFDFVGSRSNGDFVDNEHEGNPGWHAKHWFNNLNYDIYSNLLGFLSDNPPDIVLLHVGTNDIGEYFATTPAPNDNSIDTTVADVSQLLDKIFSFDPNIIVILAKIINRLDDPATIFNENTTTSLYNIALETMANTRISNGDNIKLVDMESALSYSSDLSDLVHPNTNGYEKMTNVWFDSIVNILPKLNTKVYLEGAYFNTDSMNINLSDEASFPKENPFTAAPWNYSGTEKVDTVPNNIVDWVLISLRSNSLESSTVAHRAAFLRSDGQIVDLDGTSPIAFATYEDYYYIVIEHRNHLPIMSNQKVLISP